MPSNENRLHRTGMLSKLLAEKGYEVVWFTTTFDHQTKVYVENTNVKKNVSKNLSLFFLHSETPYYKNISLKRLKNHKEVAENFYVEANKIDSPDIIFCSFPTIDLAYVATKYGKINNVPVVIDVRDLWPDIFIDIFPKFFHAFFRRLMYWQIKKTKFALTNAFAITAVSDNYLKWAINYEKNNFKKVSKVFPLGYDYEEIKEYKSDLVTNRLGIDETKINIWFVGTFGRTYDLETVIKAAKVLEVSRPKIQFIFTGDGENMSIWKEKAKGLSNVIFTGWVGKKELIYLSRISKIGLMAYRKGAPQGLPNKIFEYLAYGLPILSSLESETKELLNSHGIGFTYDASNSQDLIDKINAITSDLGKLYEMSENCRHVYRENFDSHVIYQNIINFLEEISEEYKRLNK